MDQNIWAKLLQIHNSCVLCGACSILSTTTVTILLFYVVASFVKTKDFNIE